MTHRLGYSEYEMTREVHERNGTVTMVICPAFREKSSEVREERFES